MGFWLMFFLVGFVSYWVGGATWEAYKEKKAKQKEEEAQAYFTLQKKGFVFTNPFFMPTIFGKLYFNKYIFKK